MPPVARTFTHMLPLGDGSVACREIDHGVGPVFINLHQNEATSVAAAREVLQRAPGRLLWFDAGGQRTLEGVLGGQAFVFDPNRMFSPAGIAQTLAKYNATPRPAVAACITTFAEELLTLLRPKDASRVVAIHNTGDDYCIHAYEPGGDEAPGAAAVYVAPGQHRHDFFFVTERAVFDALRGRGRHVVLQRDDPPDDGSLSVWCARQGVPYLNVEARFGATEAQVAMLEEIYGL